MIDAVPLSPSVAPAACPSCHTARLLATDEVAAASDWRCQRCGERWTASRLATVAEYEAWDRRRVSAAGRDREVTV
jgi:hypothetical protein